MWLNILAVRKISVAELAREHWLAYGRNYYTRHDYDEVDLTAGNALMDAVRARLPTLAGQKLGRGRVEKADDFAYHDPVDGSDSKGQGIRILFADGSRLVYRLSGTGTVGATIRIYIEKYEPPTGDLGQDAQVALADLIALSRDFSAASDRVPAASAPSVIT